MLDKIPFSHPSQLIYHQLCFKTLTKPINITKTQSSTTFSATFYLLEFFFSFSFLINRIPHHKTTSRVTKTHYTNKTLKAIVRNETEIKIELEAMGGSE